MVVLVVMVIAAVGSAKVWEATPGLRREARGRLHTLQHPDGSLLSSTLVAFR